MMMMMKVIDDVGYLVMKVKEVISCDVSPMAMFQYLNDATKVFDQDTQIKTWEVLNEFC